jgi:hypothetical protein
MSTVMATVAGPATAPHGTANFTYCEHFVFEQT